MLRRHVLGGGAVIAASAAFGLKDAHAQEGRWLRAESPHFIVFADSNERTLRDATQRLETFDALLRQLLQPGDAGPNLKLEVYLFRSDTDLSHTLPEAGMGVAGYYESQPDFVGAVALQNFGRADVRAFAGEVLLHEYAHHFMLNYFADAYPRWFVEGFAEFVATTEITDTDVRVGAASHFRNGILNGDWPPMDRVLKPLPDRASMVGIYGVGWLATHYLINTPERMQAFGRYLEATQAGADPLEAFQPAFGVTPNQFETELRRYRGSGMQGFVLPRVTTPDGEITVTTMPEAANELLPYVIQLRRAERDEDESEERRARRDATLAERVIRLAARYPDDPYARRALARAEMLRKRPDVARLILRPVVEADPEDTEALYLMGMTYLVEAGTGVPADFNIAAAPGRRYFARVFRINPHHVPTLYGYAQTFMNAGPLPEAPLYVLTQAHLLAPQVAEIRLKLGGELMKAGRFEDAVPVLRPAAFSPHDSAVSRQAKVMLEAAARNELPTAEALAEAARNPDD